MRQTSSPSEVGFLNQHSSYNFDHLQSSFDVWLMIKRGFCENWGWRIDRRITLRAFGKRA
jgi:hypothetical protein